MLMLLEWSAALLTWLLVRSQPVWRRVEPLVRLATLVILTLIVTFWAAVFAYLLLHHIYVPQAEVYRELHLKRGVLCRSVEIENDSECNLPRDKVSLSAHRGDSLLSLGQSYRMFVTLEVPESTVNRAIGMFLIGVKLFNIENQLILSEERSIMLEYKSELLEAIETTLFSPLYLFGDKKQKQKLTIEMFNDLKDNPYNKIHYSEVTIYNSQLQYYSAYLQFYANFSGIRSFMFYYPIFSAFCFVTIFFLSFNFLVLINWLHRQWVKLEPTTDNQGNWMDDVSVNEDILKDEDSWPEPRPCAIAGEKIVHRNYNPEIIENIGD